MDEYWLVATDADTGEEVEIPMSPAEVERMMIAAEGLPDPDDDQLDDEANDDE